MNAGDANQSPQPQMCNASLFLTKMIVGLNQIVHICIKFL